jgi:hypothetical protein
MSGVLKISLILYENEVFNKKVIFNTNAKD